MKGLHLCTGQLLNPDVTVVECSVVNDCQPSVNRTLSVKRKFKVRVVLIVISVDLIDPFNCRFFLLVKARKAKVEFITLMMALFHLGEQIRGLVLCILTYAAYWLT